MASEADYMIAAAQEEEARARRQADRHNPMTAALGRGVPHASDPLAQAEQGLKLLSAQLADPRAKALAEAAACVLQDRASQYGQPEDNFLNTARLWNAWLLGRFGPAAPELDAMDVAMMQQLLKVARLSTNRFHKDSIVDDIGYAACYARAAAVLSDKMNEPQER